MRFSFVTVRDPKWFAVNQVW